MAAKSPGSGRQAILGGIMAVLLVVAIIVWATTSKPGKPKPDLSTGAIYYTGPMAQKGNPNMIADEDGNIYPPPAKGATEAAPASGAARAKKGAAPD